MHFAFVDFSRKGAKVYLSRKEKQNHDKYRIYKTDVRGEAAFLLFL
jgi:hypothetical protein